MPSDYFLMDSHHTRISNNFSAPFGYRNEIDNKLPKGYGWLGMLPHANGGYSSEISQSGPLGKNDSGPERSYPLIVPGLSKNQLHYLLNTPIDKLGTTDKGMMQSITDAAVDFARKRIAAGQSPFRELADTPLPMRIPPQQFMK